MSFTLRADFHFVVNFFSIFSLRFRVFSLNYWIGIFHILLLLNRKDIDKGVLRCYESGVLFCYDFSLLYIL